jgi:hypothetical protein
MAYRTGASVKHSRERPAACVAQKAKPVAVRPKNPYKGPGRLSKQTLRRYRHEAIRRLPGQSSSRCILRNTSGACRQFKPPVRHPSGVRCLAAPHGTLRAYRGMTQ